MPGRVGTAFIPSDDLGGLLRFSQKVGPLFASADTVNPSFLAVHCPIPPFPACYLIKKRRDEKQWASDEWWVMSGEWRWRAGRQAFRKDPTSIPASRRIARSVPSARSPL